MVDLALGAFRIEIPERAHNDLRERLARTRLPANALHFAALEQPDRLVDDLRSFLRMVR